ncbi:hypothetical protein JXB02_01525 [Candidatus Woesearchaeota archaeon]|nr:hypothetical protein [Candidatus Woesearchaeota archaeon]
MIPIDHDTLTDVLDSGREWLTLTQINDPHTRAGYAVIVAEDEMNTYEVSERQITDYVALGPVRMNFSVPAHTKRTLAWDGTLEAVVAQAAPYLDKANVVVARAPKREGLVNAEYNVLHYLVRTYRRYKEGA